MPNVKDFVDAIEAIAPSSWSFSDDNVGLLFGDLNSEVTSVIFALDATTDLAKFAVETGASLVVTHHPTMYMSTKTITSATHEGSFMLALGRAGISHIAAHTNWDCAPGGINDTLALLLGLGDVTPFGGISTQQTAMPMPISRIGTLSARVSAREFQADVSSRLNTNCIVTGGESGTISRVAVCGGAADSEWEAALAFGADAFVTGEVRHFNAVTASIAGLCMVQAGHYATEAPGMEALLRRLSPILPVPMQFYEPLPGRSGRPF